ncbi:hypothetical protein, partial [Winogradskyella sp. A3E31]|uniref:hypothetical protein n=1 Tax=Winogradskyella sp. A3E31 TaxID=3349637 RepID=UPI00398B099C
EESVTISEPADIVLTVNSTDVTCNGAADGTITASATGGATITVDGAAYDENATYGPGTYTVRASQSDTCFEEETVTISEPDVFTVAATCGPGVCFNGGINTTSLGSAVQGGTGPFIYSWTPTTPINYFDDPTSPTPDFENAPAGQYILTLTVTDANDCEASDNIVITILEDPMVSIDPIDAICEDAEEFMLNATSDADSVLWTSNGSAVFDDATSLNPTITNFADGEIFTITATGENGCTSSASITITLIVCCEPAAVCNLQDQELDCKDIDELADFAVEFPPFTSEQYASVFTDIELCGNTPSMTYEDTDYDVQVTVNVATVFTATRTYTLTIDGEEFTCSQELKVTNAAPTINNGDDLVPGDIPNIDFMGCLPEGDIDGSFSNDLIVDCFGNPVNEANVLIEVTSVIGNDCAWTVTITTTVTTGNGETIVIREDEIDGGDDVAPTWDADQDYDQDVVCASDVTTPGVPTA